MNRLRSGLRIASVIAWAPAMVAVLVATGSFLHGWHWGVLIGAYLPGCAYFFEFYGSRSRTSPKFNAALIWFASAVFNALQYAGAGMLLWRFRDDFLDSKFGRISLGITFILLCYFAVTVIFSIAEGLYMLRLQREEKAAALRSYISKVGKLPVARPRPSPNLDMYE